MSEQEQVQTRQDIEARIIAKAWKDEAYKQELLTNPQAVLAREFGVEFPEEIKVQVLEENSSSLYFVLPMSPMAIAQELSEDQLEVIAGGNKYAKRMTVHFKTAFRTVMSIPGIFVQNVKDETIGKISKFRGPQ